MKASAATIDITPPPGLEFAGNIREDNIARGTHDPLLCNAVLMELGGVRVLLLAMDWLGFEKEDADWLRDRAGRVAGIDAGHVVVSATHTHSGPRVVTRFGLRDRAPGEDAYLRSACRKIVERAAGLPAALEPASLWRGMLPVDGLSFNRRLRLADGSLRMNWMPVEPDEVIGTTGPVDPALTVMGLRSGGGEWLAFLVNFTLHPAILVGAEWLWSADYVHYLRRALLEGLPGRPVVHFTNGAEGDVNHINYRDPTQLDGFPEAERIGAALGRAALTALEGSGPMPDALGCASGFVTLTRRAIPETLERWARLKWERCGGKVPSLHHGIPDEYYAREILLMAGQPAGEESIPMTALRIGDMAAVTLPGEVFCRIGLNIKQASPFEHTVVWGLTQDYCGYVPDRKAFCEGGYEPRTDSVSRYAEDSCDRIEAAAGRLLERLYFEEGHPGASAR